MYQTLRRASSVLESFLSSVKLPTQTKNKSIRSVAAIGSCVTRDCFTNKLNPGYDKFLHLALYCHQSSLVSQMSAPCELNPDLLQGTSDWAKKVILEDAGKSFAANLGCSKVDLIVVDLRSDVSSGAASWQGTYVTPIQWHLKGTKYGELLSATTKISPRLNLSEYIEKFEESCIKFRELVQERMPYTPIVLNTVKASPNMIKRNKSVLTDYFDVKEDNKLWSTLDQIFLELIPEAITVNGYGDNYYAAEGHPWGKASIHFEPRYYKNLSKELLKI